MRRALLLALAALAFPAAAQATDYYAHPSGSGTTCSSGSPCDIVYAAHTKATSGDTIYLLDGTYTTDTQINLPSGVRLTSNDLFNPVLLVLSGNNGLFTNNNDTVVEDIEIEYSGNNWGLLALSGQVNRVYVEATGAGNSACGPANGAVISDSVCWNSAGGYGVRMIASGDGSSTATLRNVTAVSYQPGGVGASIESYGGFDQTLNVYNTIVGGQLTGFRSTTDSTSSTSSTINVYHSNYSFTQDQGTSAATIDQFGNQYDIPLFEDPVNGDFRQFNLSPTRDAGTTIFGLGSWDLDNEDRTMHGLPQNCGDSIVLPDIGAYEYSHDCSRPNTQILSSPNRRTDNRRARFTFSSSEGGVTYQCKKDSGNWQNCSSPKAYTGLSRGRHTFRVRAIDAAGNIDPTPAKKRWRITN